MLGRSSAGQRTPCISAPHQIDCAQFQQGGGCRGLGHVWVMGSPEDMPLRQQHRRSELAGLALHPCAMAMSQCFLVSNCSILEHRDPVHRPQQHFTFKSCLLPSRPWSRTCQETGFGEVGPKLAFKASALNTSGVTGHV